MMSNNFQITGNLTNDPELRFTPAGDAVASFTVADTPRKFDKASNSWIDAGDPLFMRCSIWRDDAEAVAEAFRKGQRVTVTGRLKSRSWEKDGQKRTVVEMDADSVAGHARRAQRANTAHGSPTDPWTTSPQNGSYESEEAPF